MSIFSIFKKKEYPKAIVFGSPFYYCFVNGQDVTGTDSLVCSPSERAQVALDFEKKKSSAAKLLLDDYLDGEVPSPIREYVELELARINALQWSPDRPVCIKRSAKL